MFANFLQSFLPQEKEPQLSYRKQKMSQLAKIVDNHDFVNKTKVVTDGEILIEFFSEDRIDIFTKTSLVSLLCIQGPIAIQKNARKCVIIIDIILDASYPNQLPIFSIRNLALTDSHVKINSYYKDAISDSIILNPYLAVLSTWFEHMDISRVLKELVELISRRFPYVQAKQNSLELHTAGTPTKIAEISPLNFPQMDSFEKINQVEIIRVPLMPSSKELIGPWGIDLKIQNQLQKQINDKLVLNAQQLKNDIITQKQQYQQLQYYRQQQDGYRMQLVWNRQKVNEHTDLAHQQLQIYSKLSDQYKTLKTHSIDDYFDFDEYSNQIVEVISEIKGIEDCLRYLINHLNHSITFEATYRQFYKLSEQLFYSKLLLKKYIFINNYCNPDNLQDPLPQPYRAINKILQKDILNEVYNKVFEIEKHRSDPNYEGQLRTLPPQGIFDIPFISTISAQSSSSQVIAGDSAGNLMILDLSKKMRLCKKELGPKRILKVTSSTRENAQDDFKNVCLIALIAHLDPVVYLYRYRPGENKIFQHHTITITKNTSTIAEMPVDIELSMYSQYLLVTQYNGSVLLYKIPDMKLDQTAPKPTAPPPVGNQKQSLKVEQAPLIANNTSSTLEIVSTELGDPIYTISFKGVKKELKYEEIINKMKEANQQPKEPELAAKEDPKKKAAPAAQQKKVEVVAPVVEDLFEENENSKTIKSQVKDNIEQSEGYPEQKFQARIQFITDRLNIQQGNKAFNQFKQHEVVVGFAVGWTNTKRLEIHQIAKAHRNYLPGFLQQSLQILPPITNTKLETKIIEILILYPLTCLAVSENSLNLGVGLKQGSVYIYDLVLLQEKFYLDKHINFVSHISFCGDMRLISASYDGGVHIYELKEGKILCKRTNQFRKGTKVNVEEQKEGLWRVNSLGVSPSGIAVVLDQQGECRLYDVWHGEKIAKLTAQQVMDDKLRQWNVQKSVIQCYRNEILILSDVFNQLNQNSIQIFKIFDNLVNLFPALSNVYRKGVEKEKIINLYERIPKDQLNNPAFEVPNLLGSTQQNNNLKVPGQDSKTNRLSQKKSVLMQNSQMQQSHASRQSQDPKQKIDTSSNKDKGSLINSLHRSNVSEQQVDFNSSFRSQNNNSIHSKTGKAQQPNVLTKEMLHPEQFLLEKEKNSMPGLVRDESWMVEHCRSRNAEKAVRSDKVNSMISKVGQKLALEDEKQKLLERQRQLKSIK